MSRCRQITSIYHIKSHLREERRDRFFSTRAVPGHQHRRSLPADHGLLIVFRANRIQRLHHLRPRQESGQFLEKFYSSIQGELLSSKAGINNSGVDLESAARPLQASNAEQKYAHLTKDVDDFLASWNDNPANRSKISTLFKELEKTKDVMIDDLALSLERGQKVDQSLEKSEKLVATSNSYKRTSKQVERTMLARKWKIVIIAVLVTLAVILLIYLFSKI